MPPRPNLKEKTVQSHQKICQYDDHKTEDTEENREDTRYLYEERVTQADTFTDPVRMVAARSVKLADGSTSLILTLFQIQFF